MVRISSVELATRLLEEEYSKGFTSVNSFSKKVRLNRQSIQDMLDRKVQFIRTDNFDIILESFDISLAELEQRYGNK
ncbi:hypothetical protein [Erysipelothrix aquatica]|uniref:hypothetical protein n=1 Tax=Erysipelothrix aquatica TaxID=2683714 RepID=UPI001359B1CA|nr:hypothetical protein [Erysipelothrix aquatica]